MTSQGPHINGLDARKWISAGYACHIRGGSRKAYILPAYEQRDDLSTPVTDITSGTVVGFRYLQFGNNSPVKVTAVMRNATHGVVNVRADSHNGRIIAVLHFDGSAEAEADLLSGLIGKHAVYFEFTDLGEASLSFDRFTFD